MERAWTEVMTGDMADRPARQEIDASRDSDHTHLHLSMTLSFWPLSPSPCIYLRALVRQIKGYSMYKKMKWAPQTQDVFLSLWK